MGELIHFLEAWVWALQPGHFWLFAIVSAALACYSFYALWQGLSLTRLMAAIPTSRIRSAPQGYVELNGYVYPIDDKEILSPLSQTHCLWYRYKIEEKVTEMTTKGRRRTRWRVVEQGTSKALFGLKDETGTCVIDPEGAKVVARDKSVWHQRALLRPRRFTEELIIKAESLYGIGLFQSAKQEHASIREQVSQLLKTWKADQSTLLANYDIDNDGEISLQEWERVRHDAMLAVRRNMTAAQQQPRLNVLRASTERGQPYILSTVPEETLLRQYQIKTYLGIAGFIMAGSAFFWMMNVRMVW
jgi:hypothetical protein